MIITAPKRFTLSVLSAALVFLGTSNCVQAAVLFNNGAPDFQAAIESDFDLPVEAGDDFTFTSSNDVRRITWSGVYAVGRTASTDAAIDQFSVRVFEFLNLNPAVSPTVAFTNVTVDRSGTTNPFFYSYAFTPTQPFTLKPGKYLLSVVNNTANTSLNWFWATNARNGNSFRANTQKGNNFGRFQPDDAWFKDANFAELSFTIEGNPTSVPTPALLPGLIGLGVNLWRKRKLAANDQLTKIN